MTHPSMMRACCSPAVRNASPPQAILGQALPALTGHFERVTWWPQADSGIGWQIGDFSLCVLEFPVGDAALLYAQLTSSFETISCIG